MSRITLVEGCALPLRGNDIDTDRIMPARFLKAITFKGLEAHLFEDDRASMPGHPLDDIRFAGATVLLVNRNFGCGSSREHAPQGIVRHGFRAIIGESFSEIFFGNALMLGMPCVTVSPEAAAALQDAIERDPSVEVAVDLEAGTVRAGALTFDAGLPEAARQAFLSGEWDAVGLMRERPEEIEAVARRLPYLAGF